jgi:hypothetical protein
VCVSTGQKNPQVLPYNRLLGSIPAPWPGAPHLARFSRDVGFRRPPPQACCGTHNSVGVPHVRTSVARISYSQHWPRQRMRLSLKESRMKLLNATNLDRKSGIREPKTMGEALNSLSYRTLRFVP